ncbi:uncharacterized protein V2V93DRAFT_370878 [Kockiozyma suomiensis]|uniref:uncharacterized protein n=1 Tax=Kockiozyma suomiensis TaxID=1337062 RepID=UPI003343950A
MHHTVKKCNNDEQLSCLRLEDSGGTNATFSESSAAIVHACATNPDFNCESISTGIGTDVPFHVKFPENQLVDAFDFLADKKSPDPLIINSWYYLRRGQHSAFGTCVYCRDMERIQDFAIQRRKIAMQLVRLIHWDSAESPDSVIEKAEHMADEFVNRLKRKYYTTDLESTNYTIQGSFTNSTPAASTEQIRDEWNEYMIQVHSDIARKLQRRRLRQKFRNILPLGWR